MNNVSDKQQHGSRLANKQRIAHLLLSLAIIVLVLAGIPGIGSLGYFAMTLVAIAVGLGAVTGYDPVARFVRSPATSYADQNLGKVDRTVRAVITATLLGSVMTDSHMVTGSAFVMVAFAIYSGLTALLGWDPLYSLGSDKADAGQALRDRKERIGTVTTDRLDAANDGMTDKKGPSDTFHAA